MDSAGGPTGPHGGKPKGVKAQPKASNAMSELSDLDLGFKSLKYGDFVAGTIVRVDPRDILVDIGA